MNTNLEHLTNEELIKYEKLYHNGMSLSKRFEKRKIDGADFKFLYHVVRLLNEAEQILTKHDIDLQENNEQLKAIRRGEWTVQQIHQFFQDKERQLEEAYHKSDLRQEPDEEKLKSILIECLEAHYEDLSGEITQSDQAVNALRDIEKIIDNLKGSILK